MPADRAAPPPISAGEDRSGLSTSALALLATGLVLPVVVAIALWARRPAAE